jgi:DNA gyrase/topoisomerase IV subunit B
MSNNLYTKDSIESLSPRDFTRLRPGVYVGSTEYATHLLVEIVSNAIDEFKAGNGSHIDVKVEGTKVSVQDNGQGFLINEKREDGLTVLEAAFSVLNTSGKYKENGVYEGVALGLNGIGSKITCYLSHHLRVQTWRDGQTEIINFEEGLFKDREVKNEKHESGTLVEWDASEEFFDNPTVEMNKIEELFKTIVCLCPGLTINLDANGVPHTYQSKNGLNDLADEMTKGKEIIKNRMSINFKEGKNAMDFILTYTSNYSSTIVPYVNTGLTESGPHITQIKTTITREFNKFFKEKKWLKAKDDNLSGDDIGEGMFILFNLTAPGVSYNAQTKGTIVKIEMKPFTSSLSEELQYWLAANEKDIKEIFDKAMKAKKAREAARKAKEAIRKPKEKGLKAKMQLSDKFVDCVNKNPEDRNLLLLEGLSAGGSALEARNVKTDAIYMLRGKPISPLKQSIDKLLANQEISDIIRVIGAGFNETFDVNKMQFDKIVITADQDSDGMAIELLLITFFYTYMRPLVEAGKLYRAVTPLYILEYNKTKEYIYTEKEMTDWKEAHPNTKPNVSHCKGLGEVSPQVLKEVCFEKQRYKRITISDIEKTTELLEILEGSKVEPRKKYIYENAKELGFNFV